MALVKCPECGKEVSDTANACPNCGYGVKAHFDKMKQDNYIKKNQSIYYNTVPQKPQKEKLDSGQWLYLLVAEGFGFLCIMFGVYSGVIIIILFSLMFCIGFPVALYYLVVMVNYNQKIKKYNCMLEDFNRYKKGEIGVENIRYFNEFRNQEIRHNYAKHNNILRCPKCGSTNIQMVPRKWSPLTGFMTNKVDRVCVNCKNRF